MEPLPDASEETAPLTGAQEPESGTAIFHRTEPGDSASISSTLNRLWTHLPGTITSRRSAARTFTACIMLFAALLLLPMLLSRAGAPGRGAPDPLAAAPASAVHGAHGAVAADEPRCSKLGVRVLRALRGNAADAAVAALLCQGVLAPYASGIGGGAFILVHPSDERAPVLYDARETAPSLVDAQKYAEDASRSIRGGAAVGVPGELMGIYELHRQFGVLKWRDVVELVVPLAEESVVSEEFVHKIEADKDVILNSTALTELLRRDRPHVKAKKDAETSVEVPEVRRIAKSAVDPSPTPKFLRVGDKFRNPELAQTLRAIAEQGPDALYKTLAKNLSREVRANGGVMTEADVKKYRVVSRQPVQSTYHGFTVLGAPLPSAGGGSIAMALNILEGVNLGRKGRNRVTYAYVVEALKFVFGMRMLLGDPKFAYGALRVVRQMLDKGLARRLQRRIDVSHTYPPDHYARGLRFSPDDHGTAHVSVVDENGLAVSATSTINIGFGSGVIVGGIILNNEMDDFSASQERANYFGLYPSIANRIQPGKRPLSSMSPTIVTRAGKPFLVVGASGGPRIISATLLTMLNVLDWGDSVSEAVVAPRLHHQLVPNLVYLERVNGSSCETVHEDVGPMPPPDPALKAGWKYWPSVCRALKNAGHKVSGSTLVGAVQAVLIPSALDREKNAKRQVYAASDPRKLGRAAAY